RDYGVSETSASMMWFAPPQDLWGGTLHARLTGCFGTDREEWTGNRPFQRLRFSSIEGGVRRRAGTEGPGVGWRLGGRARVYGRRSSCGSGSKSAGGIRFPDLS